MSHNDGSSGRSSYFESSFDYRSLIPQRFGVSSEPDQSQDDMESGTAISAGRSGCAEMCGDFLPEMTWRERVIGCATCMVAGYLLSLGSFVRLKDLLFGNPVPLVLNATIGNLIALAGSCFLSGPGNQFNRMWAEKRRIATAMYIGSLFFTLLVVCLPIPGPKGFLLLLLLLSQYVSITWYCLSYIPMAQEFVSRYARRLITNVDEF